MKPNLCVEARDGVLVCSRARTFVVEVNYVFLGYLPTPFHVYQMRWKNTADDD